MNRVFLFLALIAFQSELLAADANEPFSFVALGDTAYSEDRYREYDALIQTINQSSAAFSIHVGDTMGYQMCDQKGDQQVRKFFDQFQMPVVYTPGDNEWRDCYLLSDKEDEEAEVRNRAFRLERLETLRQEFFSKPESLGRTKISVTRQSDVSEFSRMVENAYWVHGNVLFATLHLVGSGNGMNPWSEAMSIEAVRRTKANGAWIRAVAKIAADEDVDAVVLAMHAGLFDHGMASGLMSDIVGTQIRGGFYSSYGHTVFELLPFFASFEKPILVLHGDYHEFIVDRPFLVYKSEENPDANRNKHVTRLQVFGAPELKAVKVTVEPDTPWVFSFSPLY